MTKPTLAIKKNLARTLLSLLILGLVCACSGGGGGNANAGSTTATPRLGVFGAIPTAGIRYQSTSHSGVTNAAGEFDYTPGEEIEFFLGEMILGIAPGATRVNEFDIAGLTESLQSEAQWIGYYELHSQRSPLAKAANVAGILQTLDTNQDFSDGIDILPAVAALFSANQIDLYQPYWQFKNDRRMRKLLFRATNQADLPPRALRTGSLALQHLFSFNVNRHQHYEQDNGNDGLPDYVLDYTYNSQGKVVSTVIDSDGDSVVDRHHFSTFNNNNIEVSTRTEDNNDGIMSSGWEETLNDFGMRTERVNFGRDGIVVSTQTQRWDDDGALIYRETNSTEVHTIEHWNYEEGLLVDYSKDADGNGSVDERQYFAGVDLNTDYTQRRIDTDADGIIDVVYEYTLNPLGQALRTTKDDGADGIIDETIENDYNDFGETIETRNYLGEDILTRRFVWNYSSDARRINATRDSTGDGSIDWMATYVPETASTPREVRYDFDGDGIDNVIYYYTYSAEGMLMGGETDSNGDGTIDSSFTHIYEDSRRIRTETDNDGDGLIDRVTHQTDWVTVPVTALL